MVRSRFVNKIVERRLNKELSCGTINSSMGKLNITKEFVYKWRYIIGYSAIAAFLLLVLVVLGTHIPGGLSPAEITSVIKSSATNFKDFWSVDVVNLPYYVLQHISFIIFGVSLFSIKLPSIILAFLSAIGILILLKQWFKPNIAILATLIALATSQFMFISQNGTPDIMYIFWPVWLILLAGVISSCKKFRKLSVVLFFVAAALSLYTPLMAYIILVIAGAIIFHPHLRYLIKQISNLDIIIGLVLIITILSPLAMMIYRHPDIILTLLGVPTKLPNLALNLSSLANQYASFINPGGTVVMTPIFELGSALLILLGVYFVYLNRSTAKSYVLIIWTACLIPIILLNPTATTVTYIPLILLLASGINGLLSHWYELFPKNPYARVGGLVPVIVMVVILVASGVNRYLYSYRYTPSLVNSFSYDIRYLPTRTKYLLVSGKERDFYLVVAKYDHGITLIDKPGGDSFVTTHDAKGNFDGYTIKSIVTNSLSKDADRFYLYKKTSS